MSPIASALPIAVQSLVDTFDVSRAYADLRQLCSDAFAGRRIGTAGHDLAQAWLRQQMADLGLDAYVSHFTAESAVLSMRSLPQFQVWGSDAIRRALEYRREFQEHAQSVFQANGVEGIAYRGTPRQGWLISESLPPVQQVEQWLTAGLVGILISQHVGPNGYLPKRIMPKLPLPLTVIAVCDDVLPQLEGQTVRATMPLERLTVVGGHVLGSMPRTDPLLANEPLIVGAHFDGVGDDVAGYRIPGAADNAAGVAVVLELARVIGRWQDKPYRQILFAAFDGEEINAVGSQRLAQSFRAEGKRPFVINLDGAAQFHEAVWTELSEHAGPLIQALDRAGEALEIPLVVGAVGSDNRRYAQAGFPTAGVALGGSGGHTPADTIDHVDGEAMRLAGRLLLATIWQLAFAKVTAQQVYKG